MAEKKPAPPAGVGAPAARLWRDVLDRYELSAHEVSLLREVVRVVGRLEALEAVVRADGPMDPAGTGRVHPALVEARQQQLALAKLVGALRLPDEGSASGGSSLSDAMREVAEARWRGERRGA